MSEFVSYCFLLAIIGCSQAKPQITSGPEIIGVNIGEAAMLTCRISNPQDSVVSWSSVTYNLKIFQGSQLLVNDADKYSVKKAAGGQIYNLQILNVEKSDQGYYKCAIEGTDQQIITQLNVLDRPSMLLPEGSILNVTDCCLAEGISESCLPVCYPSQIDLQEFSLTNNCGTAEDLQGLSKCLTRGSNHDNCCLNMKVNAWCLDICHNDVPDNVSMEYFSRCFADKIITGIFSCFEIGSESLPSEPTDVAAVALCDTPSGSILVKWSAPTKNPQKVTGYKIMYKSGMQETYNSVLVKNPKALQYLLSSSENMILADTDYKLHVSALAVKGISFESVELNVYVTNCTLPEKQTTSIIGTFPEKQTTGIIARPINLMATHIGNSADVLLTWDVQFDGSYSSFIVFYKTLSAEKYTVVSDITSRFYKLRDLELHTEYTAYVVAFGDEHFFSQSSVDVNFLSSSNTAPTRSTDRQTDDDRMTKVAIGVGVSMSVVCLTAIILLAIFLIHKARFQGSMAFDNSSFYSTQELKLEAEVDKHSSGKKQSDAPEVLDIKDNTSTGKFVTDFDKNICWTVYSSSATTDPVPVVPKS